MASSYDGHISKRQRTEDGGRAFAEQQDRHNPECSPVVHVRGLPEHATEEDIASAVQHFGAVEFVMTIPRRHQALVEFRDMKASKACVGYAATNQLYICGQPVYFNYSTSQKIQRGENGIGRPPISDHNILLFTVINAQYPITVEVMHTICSPHGNVEKIVIFKKHYVQCMVQFATSEAAKAAKQQLNGCDIYSGCCTLKIEYAKTSQLNVKVNNSESWDYTIPAQAVAPKQPDQRRGPPLLADPRYSAAPTPYSEMDDYSAAQRSAQGAYGSQYEQGDAGGYAAYQTNSTSRNAQQMSGYTNMQQQRPGGYGQETTATQADAAAWGQQQGGYGMPGMNQGRPAAGGFGTAGYGQGQMGTGYMESQGVGGGAQQGCVVMVYGLNMEHMNAERVFNIFCLYGNVVRVKFLKTKEGAAMVQMGDNIAVERAIFNLSGVEFFGKKLSVTQSKQMFLQDVNNPHELPDGTMSFKDFMGNRNNRFSTPEAAAKNRILHPTEILHYYNAPPKITEEELKQVFVDAGASPPKKLLQFQGKSDKSSTGLIEWDSKSEALEALCISNHASIPNPNGRPYVLKLCFSQNNIREHQ